MIEIVETFLGLVLPLMLVLAAFDFVVRVAR